jgi:hypothetical protein
MNEDTRSAQFRAVIAVIIGGVALSFAAAVIPHFTAGYRLEPLILVPGLVLYLIFGILAYFLPARKGAVVGTIILGLHLLVVVQQRWLTNGYEDSSLLSWFPLALTVAALGLIPEAWGNAGYPAGKR